MAKDFPLLSLKLALQARRGAPAAELDPSVLMQPVVDKLSEIELALGIISRNPRHVASP